MKNLRALRNEFGLSMKALGQEIGVAESTISLYETGKRTPDITTLIRLADYFDVPVDDLIGHEDTFGTSAYMRALHHYCAIAEEAYGENRYPSIVKFYHEHPEYVGARLSSLPMKFPERQALRDILGLDVSIAIALGCSLCEKAEDYSDFYQSSEDALTRIGQNIIVGQFTNADRDLLHAYHSASDEVRSIFDSIAHQCTQPRAAAARGDIDLTKEDLSTLTLPDTEDSSPVP